MEPAGTEDEIAELERELKILQEEEDAIDAIEGIEKAIEQANNDLKKRQNEGHSRLFGVDVCIAVGALFGAQKKAAINQLMSVIDFAREFHPDALPRVALMDAETAEVLLDFDHSNEKMEENLSLLFENAVLRKQTEAAHCLTFLQASPSLCWRSATRVLFHATVNIENVSAMESSISTALADLEAKKLSYWLCSPSSSSPSTQRLRDVMKKNIQKGYSCGMPFLESNASNFGTCLKLAIQKAMEGCKSFKS